MRRMNLEGKRYGELVVLQLLGVQGHNRMPHYLCKCSCGNTSKVSHGNLRSGHTKSCGCLLNRTGKAHPSSTHGMRSTKEYKAWCKIRERCFNESNVSYNDYGARGITMADDFRNNFEAFFAEIGPAPTLAHSVDRIDNTLGYVHGNMRWATTTQQARNRSKFRVNSSGETGVNYYHSGNPAHATYAVAQWKDLTGKAENKKFSVCKYGLLPAFKMAVLYRREQINQLNQQGAGYSAQHGKDRNEY